MEKNAKNKKKTSIYGRFCFLETKKCLKKGFLELKKAQIAPF